MIKNKEFNPDVKFMDVLYNNVLEDEVYNKLQNIKHAKLNQKEIRSFLLKQQIMSPAKSAMQMQ